MVADFLDQRLWIGIGVGERSEIMVVIFVATQPFPSEIGRGEIIDMIVVRGHAPLGCVWRHRVPPPRFIDLRGDRDFPEKLRTGSPDEGKE